MPIYEYTHTNKEDNQNCSLGFEIMQPITAAPLTTCPRCGKPCIKKYSSFTSPQSTNSSLSKSNLEKHGFTQFKKKGKGYYEKTAGEGPAGFVGDGQ